MDYINNKRAHEGQLEYQIFWVDYTEPTWEPVKTIQTDCPQLVYCFERNLLLLLQHLKDYAFGAFNTVRDVNAVTAELVATMHQECRQLRAACRTKDEQLQRAMQNRHQLGSFQCYICHKKYNRKDRVFGHFREHHVHGKNVSVVCGKCNKPLSNSYALRRHMLSQHKILHF